MNLKKITRPCLPLLASFTLSVAYAEEPHWTYDEQDIWGSLEDLTQPIPARYPYAECGIGKKQSPVDISAPLATLGVNSIRTLYKATPWTITNNGHTIMVSMPLDSINQLRVGVEKYPLLQFHFHAPSEHTINGKAFPLEIHFVNASSNGKLAVVGVLVKEGAASPEFQKILDNAPTIENTTNNPTVTLYPSRLLPDDTAHFFNYAGSLTTPPCTEGVDWHVLTTPIEASAEQITQFEALYSGNARTTQDLNGRVVKRRRTL